VMSKILQAARGQLDSDGIEAALALTTAAE
jgi:hypothetical protein